MATLKELQEKRNQLAANIKELADKNAADPKAWSADDETKWAEINAAYDANKAELDREIEAVNKARDDQEKRAKRLQEIEGHLADNIAFGGDNGDPSTGPVNKERFGGKSELDFSRTQAVALQGWMLANSPSLVNQVKDEHREAAKRIGVNLSDREVVFRVGNTSHFNRVQDFYRNGTVTNAAGQRINSQFVNALLEGQPTKGGFLVADTMLGRFEQALLDYSGVLQVAEVLRTSTGETLLWPMVDDTSNTGSRVGESNDAGSASDPTFGRLRLNAHTFTSGQMNVSRSLLTDTTVIDLETLIGDMLGTRIGRKMNTDFTTGGGGGTAPLGIVTGSSAGKTAASATAIVFDELIDLAHSVDPAYRSQPGAGYMMHDSILQVIRKLKDGNGQYLWSNGTQAMEPDRINGFPYWINQAMQSSVATGTKTVLFGLLRNYKVRMVNELRIQRLIERRAEYDEDAFIAYMRADGGLLNPGVNSVKHLVQA